MTVDAVLPAYDEAATIESTVRSWVAELAEVAGGGRVVVTEDGSSDGTPAIVRRLAAQLPVELLHDDNRLGYSEAVVRGIRATTAEVIVCADADGQCDPGELGRLLDRWAAGDVDVVVGTRVHRADSGARRSMSRALRWWFRLVHRIDLEDPSSPFVVGTGDLVRRVAAAAPLLGQGYWWEFHVRARAQGLRVVEVPVRHRARLEGDTRVYRWSSVPRIAAAHVLGIWRLRDLG